MPFSVPSPFLGLWCHFSLYSGSWVFFSIFFLSFSFTTSTCLCFLLDPSSLKQKKKRKKKGKKNTILFSELQLSVQQWGRKHTAASHFCNLYHAFLEKWPVWSWGHLCPLTWLGCGGQRKGVKQGQGIQSGVLEMLPLSTKGDPTVFFLFLKAGLKLLYKNLGYLAWRHLACPQRALPVILYSTDVAFLLFPGPTSPSCSWAAGAGNCDETELSVRITSLCCAQQPIWVCIWIQS